MLFILLGAFWLQKPLRYLHTALQRKTKAKINNVLRRQAHRTIKILSFSHRYNFVRKRENYISHTSHHNNNKTIMATFICACNMKAVCTSSYRASAIVITSGCHYRDRYKLPQSGPTGSIIPTAFNCRWKSARIVQSVLILVHDHKKNLLFKNTYTFKTSLLLRRAILEKLWRVFCSLNSFPESWDKAKVLQLCERSIWNR